MVPIPSASKRDECLAERDWPAVTSWTRRVAMRWNVLFVAATLLVAASLPSAAQISIDMNKITRGGWLGYSPEERDFVRFWMSGYYNSAANSKILNYDRFPTSPRPCRRRLKTLACGSERRNASRLPPDKQSEGRARSRQWKAASDVVQSNLNSAQLSSK